MVQTIAAAVMFLLGLWLAPAVLAQDSCGLETRVPFAGHNFPLDGDLVEESIAVVTAFPNIGVPTPPIIDKPVSITNSGDGTNRLFTLQQDGRIHVFPNDPAVTKAEVKLFLDLGSEIDFSFGEEGLLGLAFHPLYQSNGFFYVYYTSQTCSFSAANRCARIARYSVDANDPDAADPNSAFIVLEIDRPGSDQEHNGGTLAFGGDGYLYASIGEGGESQLSPDPSSLRGKILRIDVDSGSEFNPGIPQDNPFGNEVWHKGLRNPWRFSFDRDNPNDLWIGDVGAALREEVNYVAAASGGGLDFGWPSCEGTLDNPGTVGSCDPSTQPPDLEYGHSGGLRVVIGGYVYRGPILSLAGKYVYADINGQVWAWDGVTRDADPPFLGMPEAIAFRGDKFWGFGEDEAGELYLVGPNGKRIFRLEPSPTGGGDPFPEMLSQTGVFSDTANLVPAAGLIEYDVASRLWSDFAIKTRWMGLPAGEKIEFSASANWSYPVGTIFVKHFELDTGDPQPRRLETRIMLHQNSRWIGFTYQWNAQQTDAQLLRAEVQEDIPLAGGGDQTWIYPSPNACLGCHTAETGRVLGGRSRQLNSDFDYAGEIDNQLHAWNCIDLFDTDIGDPAQFVRSAPLDDLGASRQHRVRSYLDSNCAICHQPGTGVANIDLRADILLGDANMIDEPPVRGDLGLPDPMLIEAGEHTNSVLWLRTDTTDAALRMAEGTLLRDVDAIAEIQAWIDQDLFDSMSGLAFIDSDEDGVEDASDNCPGVPNAGQENADGDATGDLCDLDLIPDLRAAPTGPAQASFGQPVALRADLFNDGVLSAPVSQLKFFVSLDAVLGAGDLLVGDCFAPATAGGASGSCVDSGGRVPLESELGPEGSYFWLACADSLELVAESNEQNNCASLPVLIPEPDASLLRSVALLALVGGHAFLRRRRQQPR